MADRDIAKEKAARLLKKRGSVSTINSDIHQQNKNASHHPQSHHKYQGSMSTVSYQDDPGHEDSGKAVRFENTFQLTAQNRFPDNAVSNIIKDVLESYLLDQKYEPDICRQMSKTLSEVVKARVKELEIPRFKVITLITIGSIKDQGMAVGSRCLWDSSVDTYSSYEFKNPHLFAVGTVYGVYTE